MGPTTKMGFYTLYYSIPICRTKEKLVTRPRSPSASYLPPTDPLRPKTPEESLLRNTRRLLFLIPFRTFSLFSQSNSRVSLANVRAPFPAVKVEKAKPTSRKASPIEEKKTFAPLDAWIGKFETKHKKSIKNSKIRIQSEFFWDYCN